MTERRKQWVWAFGLFAVLFAISSATCWNVLSDPEQVLAFNDGNIESVLSPELRFPESMLRVWASQFFFGSGGKQIGVSVSAILECIGPVFTRRTGQPLLLALCGLAIFWSLRQFRINRPASVLTAAILINTGWATTFAFTGLAVRPLALTFTFIAIGFAEQGRISGRWLPYAIGGACLGLGITEVPDVGAILAMGAALVFWWTHVWGEARTQKSGVRSQKSEEAHRLGEGGSTVYSLQSTVCSLLHTLPRFALFVAFSGLFAWQMISVMFATQIQGISQGAEESPAARYAWATQWSIPPAELWNTVSGSYFGTSMRSDTTPYWGRVGRSEGWEKTQQGTRNFSLTGWHLGVIPCILLLALPIWVFCLRGSSTEQGTIGQDKTNTPHLNPLPQGERKQQGGNPPLPLPSGERVGVRVSATDPLPPGIRPLTWMVCTGGLIALLLMVGKYFFAYRLLWMLPFFDTIRNPEKWNGPFLLCAGLGIAFILGRLWDSLDRLPRPGDVAPSKKPRDQRALQTLTDALATPWRAVIWTSFGMTALALLICFWTLTNKTSFLEARTRDGYGAAAGIMWDNALSASFKVALLAGIFGGIAVWMMRRIRQGKPTHPWLLATLVAALALGDLMTVNWTYAMPHKYGQYLTPNPLADYLDAHRTEGRLKLLPPQHPLLNNLRLSLLQIKGYDLFDPVSVSRMPADYEALFKALESQPARLWALGAIRYFLTLPNAVQQLNQMDGNRGRFVERLAMGVEVVNESYVPIGYAPAEKRYLRLVEFTGALPFYRLVSKVTCLPDTVEGSNAALKRMAETDFDVSHEALIHSDTSITFPAPAVTSSVIILNQEPARAKIRVIADQPQLLVRAVKFDPDWKVAMDEQPATLHRVNYLFQGVIVPPGQHTLSFVYAPSLSSSAISLASRGLLLMMIGTHLLLSRRHSRPELFV